MPDSASLEMPGSSQQKGVPGWLMVVGAVAGVAGLVLLLKGSGGGGGTTAAGTSINAALGSIQEENMNLLGVTQAGFMESQQSFASLGSQFDQEFGTINTGMTQGFLNTQNSIGGLGTQMSAGFANTNGLIAALEHDIESQLGAFSSQTQNNYNNLSSLIVAGQATQAQVNSANQSLLQSIQQDVQSGLVGQQQANSMISNMEGQLGALSGQVGGIAWAQQDAARWLQMINAREMPGGGGNPNNWPGGQIPSWFSGHA